MNIKCKKCNTTFEFVNKNSEATDIKFKCSVCGNIWNWEKKKSTILKEPSKTIFPGYSLLIILNVIMLTLVIIGFFFFREKLEFIDSYWKNIYLFFDSLVPIQ